MASGPNMPPFHTPTEKISLLVIFDENIGFESKRRTSSNKFCVQIHGIGLEARFFYDKLQFAKNCPLPMQWQCMLNLSNFSYTMYESKNSAKFRTYTFTQCKIAHKIDWKRSLVLGLQNRYLPFSYPKNSEGEFERL